MSDFTPDDSDNTSEEVNEEQDDDFAALVAEFEAKYQNDHPDEVDEIVPDQDEGDPLPEPHSAEVGDEPSYIAPDPGPQPDTKINVLDREWERDQIESLVEFYDWLAANPQAAMDIDRYARGQARLAPLEDPAAPPPQPAPQPTPQPVDESIYEDIDPAIAAKLRKIDEIAAVQEQQSATQEQFLQAEQTQRAQERYQVAQDAVARGAENFATRYGLGPEAIQALQDETAQLEILPGLAKQKGDYLAAVEEALEIAYWRNPEYREQAIEQRVQAQSQERKRQSKANALTGSSGSQPREAPQFDLSTEEGRRKAMVADLKASLDDS